MNHIKLKILAIIILMATSTLLSQTWSTSFNGIDSLYGGFPPSPYTFYNDGDSVLYIGGNFIGVNTTDVNGIFKWNGTNWYNLGNGVTQGTGATYCLNMYNNKLFMGGGLGGWKPAKY